MKTKFSKFLVYSCKILGATFYSFEDENTLRAKIKNCIWCGPIWIFYVACVTYICIYFRFGTLQSVIAFCNLSTVINSFLQFPLIFLFAVKNIAVTRQVMQELDGIDKNLKNNIKSRDSKVNVFIIIFATFLTFLDIIIKIIYFHGTRQVLIFGSYIFGYIVSLYETCLIAIIVNEIKRQHTMINIRFEKLALCIFKSVPKWKQNYIATNTVNGIEALTGYHLQLVNVAHRTYSIYQPSILRSIIGFFGLMCLGMFSGINYVTTFYKTRAIQLTFSSAIQFQAALISLIVVWYIIRTWMLLISEAKKTATYIHDIWNKYSSENLIDQNVNHLQLISLQLLNTELNFTAYGFFPLNWTFLHTIIGAVTSYVIILIQFDME